MNARTFLAVRTLAGVLMCFGFGILFGQEEEKPRETKFKEPLTATWVNTYGNIRLADRWFWIAQTHFRFQESPSTPFVGQLAQLYNRHAISYLYSKYFRVSVGGVLRVNYNQGALDEVGEVNAVPEYRIWHEYQFAQPLARVMLYHRIRLEHRWSKGFLAEDEYIFRNRWRYMLRMKIPLNSYKLAPGTFYLAPETELIMQSGKSVIDSPMEDLRMTGTLGYIANPQLTLAAGGMYSFGQDLGDGSVYKRKFTIRLHAYFTPDFRKVKNKLPMIHLDE